MKFYNTHARRAAAAIGKARSDGRQAAKEGRDYSDCPYTDNPALRQNWTEAFELERVRIMERWRLKQGV